MKPVKGTRPKRRPLPTAGRRGATVSTEKLVEIRPLSADHRLPLLATPPTAGVSLIDWMKNHRELVDEKLRESGGILFRGFDIDSPETFEELIGVASGTTLEYRERSSPRSRVSGNIYTSTDYPPDQPIFFHNENSYQHKWPMKIFFYCHIEPTKGGITPIADVRRVYERIDPALRQRFEELGVMYMRNFSEGMGLSWREVFQTDDQKQVEQYCTQAGLELEWKADGGLRTRTRRPAVRRHPKTGEPVWFNHATFFHITTLPEAIRQGLMTELAEEDLPSHSYFGDGSRIDEDAAEALRQAYRDEAVRFSWQKGDVLMLDNMMSAHARDPYEGERKILVGMAEPLAHDDPSLN